MIDIRDKLLLNDIDDCNTLVTIITAYIQDTKSRTLYQYAKTWLPILDNKIFILMNVLTFIDQHDIGSYLWYHTISQFILLTHNTISFNTIKTPNDAYKYIHKIVKINHCFDEHTIDFLKELPICNEIHNQMKLKIVNHKKEIETIKKDAVIQLTNHLQKN